MNPTLSYAGAVNTIRRDPELVFRALRSILQQRPAPVTVVLIDQNEKPLTLPPDLQTSVRQISVRAPSPSAARNLVPMDLAVDWVLFCDDDGYMADDYVPEMLKLLQQRPDLELIAGPYVNDQDGRYYSPRFAVGGRLDSLLGAKLLIGGNFAIRLLTYNRLNRYDERFGTGATWASGEETDLCWKAVAEHVPMLYSPKIRVFHPAAHDPDTAFAIRKAYRYGRGKGALAAKWIFERPHRLGFWEFLEMNIIPFVNILRSLLRGELRQIPIQLASLAGRYRGFFEFLLWRGRPS